MQSRVRAVLRGHTAEVVSASYDAGGRRIVTAGWDGTARVWDATTGESEAVLQAGDRRLETAAFSPDGKRVVTAGDDGVARVWNAETGAGLAVLRHEPGSSVLDAGFAPGGRFVVTAGSDGTARLWNAEHRQGGGHARPRRRAGDAARGLQPRRLEGGDRR